MGHEVIRYYKGGQKCKVLKQCQGRSLIKFLEDGFFDKGQKIVTITRLCWREKK